MSEDFNAGLREPALMELVSEEADSGVALAGTGERGMSEDQARTLSARAYVDAGFRALLLRDPAKAAAQLGMVLSSSQHEEILRHAAAIKNHGKHADAILAQPGAKLLIPLIILR